MDLSLRSEMSHIGAWQIFTHKTAQDTFQNIRNKLTVLPAPGHQCWPLQEFAGN